MKVLARMEQNGVESIVKRYDSALLFLTGEMIELEKQIHELADMNLMCHQPAQVAKFFWSIETWRKSEKTKTGQYSTSEDVLEKIRSETSDYW